MSPSLRPLFSAVLLLVLATPAISQEALPRLVRTQVEFIEVSHTKYTELTFGPHASSNNTELRQKLDELVRKGEAKVAETMMCISLSGDQASTASFDELIYPTEYKGAEMPNTVQIESASNEPLSLNRGLGGPPKPASFETRNIGSTLEIEPTIAEKGRFLHLRMACELTQHSDDTTWAEWNDDKGDASIRMPNVYTARVDTKTVVLGGEYTLVAALTPNAAAGNADFSRKWMVFVKCDILLVGAPEGAR